MNESKARNSDVTVDLHDTLVLTRIFDAPRRLLFKLWTDPKHLAQWWGPHGFTNPICELDPRTGGAINVHMCGPDGRVYPMIGVYQEIVEPERIVFTSAALDEHGEPLFEVLNTVTMAEQDGKTTLTLRAKILQSTSQGERYLTGMEEGWTQSLVRLGAYVMKTSPVANAMTEPENAPLNASDREIIVTRIFDARRELVFRAWTEQKHVEKWWGPKGFTNTFEKFEMRPGGTWLFVMHGPDGINYPNKIVFNEVRKPERLIYTHGEEGEPAYFESTVTFEAIEDKTKVILRLRFPTAAARNNVVQKYNAIEGGNQTMDRLGEYVAKIWGGS